MERGAAGGAEAADVGLSGVEAEGVGAAARDVGQEPAVPGFGWSDEARAMIRPFATYRQIAAATLARRGAWLAIRRPLAYLGLLGGFVSMSASGRLVLPHVLGTMVFWLFVPALQILAVLLVRRTLARRHAVAPCIDLFFVGQAPWLLLLLGMVGICLFAPHVYSAFSTLLRSGALPIMMVLTFAWSALLTFAFYRAGLALSWRRSGVAFATHYALYSGAILLYFWLTNQIQPLLIAVPT